MKRLWTPLLILVVCALVAQWAASRPTNPSHRESLSPGAHFAEVPWQSVRAAKIGGKHIVVADPGRVSALVHLLADPPELWHQGGMYSDAAFAEFVLVGHTQEARFVLSDSTLYWDGPGADMMRRPFSRWERNQLARLFQSTPITQPTMLDVDDFNMLLECARPAALAPVQKDTERYPSRQANEIPSILFGDVTVDAVWRKGRCGARVAYTNVNFLSRMGIRSGDIVWAVNGTPVWAGSRWECDRFEATEVSDYSLDLERGHESVRLDLNLRAAGMSFLQGW